MLTFGITLYNPLVLLIIFSPTGYISDKIGRKFGMVSAFLCLSRPYQVPSDDRHRHRSTLFRTRRCLFWSSR